MKGSFFSLLQSHQKVQALEKELARLKQINQVLMDRSEQQPSTQTAYSLFHTAAALEDKVNVRTAELSRANQLLQEEIIERRRAQRALNVAKVEAERANRNKTRFLSAVSHDLAQPLNAARLLLTALDEQLESSAQSDMVEHIAFSLRSMEQLLNSLVDISKLEANVMSAQRRVFALEPLLAHLAAEYALVAERKGLRLEHVPTQAVVDSDPDLLERILRNLLSNAIRYTQKGRVLLGCRRQSGQRICVGVYDTGIGIAESEQSRIFEEFQQLQNTHQLQGEKGLGLGLAIVHRIATLLSHPITLKSQLGRGTRIGVGLPLAHFPPPLVPKRQSISARTDLDGIQVALVDNDPLSIAGMRELLTHWGCHVTHAASAEQLLPLLAHTEIDVLLVDYHLDDNRTGLEAADYLQQALSRSTLPVVLITADKTLDLQDTLQAKGQHLLYKPVNPARLRALMGRILG